MRFFHFFLGHFRIIACTNLNPFLDPIRFGSTVIFKSLLVPILFRTWNAWIKLPVAVTEKTQIPYSIIHNCSADV